MFKNSFSEGIEAIYNNHSGYIKFVCDDYVTLCIHTNPNPMKDVCLVIYKNNWEKIKLLKESTK